MNVNIEYYKNINKKCKSKNNYLQWYVSITRLYDIGSKTQNPTVIFHIHYLLNNLINLQDQF